MQIPLTDELRKVLENQHKSSKIKRESDRIKTILLLNSGYSGIEISKILLIDEDTVTNWKKKFLNSESIEDYLKDNYKGYDGKLNEKQIESLKEYIDSNVIYDSKQVLEYIKKEFNIEYSESGVVELLKRLNYSYKQLKRFNSKSDEELQNKFLQGFEALNENLNEDEVILFIDGVHPQHNSHTSKAWIETGKEAYVECNTGRNRMNVNGAYNPNTQEVFVVECESVNVDSTIELFEQVSQAYSDKNIIYVFCDNAKYYRSAKVEEYLENSKICLIFLPVYSPNLNLIERLWNFMRRKVINRNYYEKFCDFRKAILNFFNNIKDYKEELKQFIGLKFHIIYPEYRKTTLA